MAETGARATRTGKTFQDGYAQRIVTVIDDRIAKATRSEAGTETTWGTVASVSSDGQEASAYLYGDASNPSVHFRVMGGEVLTVGDKVKVAINLRGDKWVAERLVSTAYRKVEIDQATGEVRTGDGTAPPTTRITASGVSMSHAALTGVTADQHHARAHSHSNSADEDDLAPVSLTIGSTPDIRFTRSSAKVLVVDDGAGGGLTTIDLLGAVALRLGGDVSISRGAADRLDLASGDSLRVSDTGQIQWSDITLSRAAAGQLGLTGLLHVVAGDPTANALELRDDGDSTPRFAIRADGQMEWGSGSAGRDVVLERGAADRLDLNSGDSFRIISGELQFSTDVVLSRTAANVLTLASGDLFESDYVGCVLTHNTTQTITTALDTELSWNTETLDPLGFHSGTGADIVIPTGLGGLYVVTAWCGWATSSTGYRMIYLFHEGENSSFGADRVTAGATSFNVENCVSAVYWLADGDTISVRVRHTQGSNTTVNAEPQFGMVRIGV